MTPIVPTLERERAAWAEEQLLVGVDEVGRGPLAGPVVAAAVVFPTGCATLDGVRDSKTLPPPRRIELAALICDAALAIGIGAASVREIDRLNIRVATAVAMRRAVARAERMLHARVALVCARRILLDGLPLPELGFAHEALVDGDVFCFSIAAAGIVAKTIRDQLMARLARRYPGYAWESNMGYGTASHHDGLRAHGLTPHHRRSFGPVAQLSVI